MLTGQQTPDEGLVEPGETVVFGCYDQMGMVLDDDQRVMDFVKQRVLARDGSALAEAPSEVMKLLKQFQFPKERWNERILRLSGGERRRLQLLSVLTQRPNFLILDEPVSTLFNCTVYDGNSPILTLNFRTHPSLISPPTVDQ
jgi:ATP-binding cassette subfamily F protein uup